MMKVTANNICSLVLPVALLAPLCATAKTPTIDWAYYFGGGSTEYVEKIVVDVEGNVAITGKTTSPADISSDGLTSYAGGEDAFVAKFDSSGNLLWSRYFGGPGNEYAYAMSTDSLGNLYIAGDTTSKTGIAFGTAHQATFAGGKDQFIAKFDPQGTLIWSTYYGGPGKDQALSLFNDATDNVVVAGWSLSASGISTLGAYQEVPNGNGDLTLAKFSSDGQLLWGTYMGGAGFDRAHDVTVDPSGNIIVSGTTPSPTGIATPGAFDESFHGLTDMFLAKFSADGVLQWSTYYGGNHIDRGRDIDTDAEGNIYFLGFTHSNDMITTFNAYQPTWYEAYDSNGTPKADAFLARFSPDGQIQWATYAGGEGDEFARGLQVAPNGTLFISGTTTSKNGMATLDASQSNPHSFLDAFLMQFDSNGVSLFRTYYGGTSTEAMGQKGYGPTLGIDPQGVIYLTVSTASSDIPALNAQHSTSKSFYDAIVARFNFQEPCVECEH